jgi:hypothetical protein
LGSPSANQPVWESALRVTGDLRVDTLTTQCLQGDRRGSGVAGRVARGVAPGLPGARGILIFDFRFERGERVVRVGFRGLPGLTPCLKGTVGR